MIAIEEHYAKLACCIEGRLEIGDYLKVEEAKDHCTYISKSRPDQGPSHVSSGPVRDAMSRWSNPAFETAGEEKHTHTEWVCNDADVLSAVNSLVISLV